MEFAIKRLRPDGVVQMVQRFAGDMESMRQRRAAEVVSALADYPFELVSLKAYPYTEPTPDDATVVKSVFVDLSSRPGFALSALMRRTDEPDETGWPHRRSSSASMRTGSISSMATSRSRRCLTLDEKVNGVRRPPPGSAGRRLRPSD